MCACVGSGLDSAWLAGSSTMGDFFFFFQGVGVTIVLIFWGEPGLCALVVGEFPLELNRLMEDSENILVDYQMFWNT